MKKNILITLPIAFILLFISNLQAQSVSDLRVNEVLLYNDSSIVDEYGTRAPWIEIFNTAYNQVDMSSCYLTNDMNNPTKYKLNKGTGANYIAGRSFELFWANGDSVKSIFHLNFSLKEGDIVALFDGDGNLIDSISLPSPQQSNISYGAIDDGFFDNTFLKYPTPGTTNTPEAIVSAAEKFIELDPWGIGMTAIAMTVVFSSLIMLFFVFSSIGSFFKYQEKKKAANKDGKANVSSEADTHTNGCVYAAIGLALHQYSSEMHDFEEAVLTINKVSRSYSPWSSKIYTLRQTPEKR